MVFRLRDADKTLRLFISTFLVVLSAGYFVGIFLVEQTTSVTPRGVQEQYLGNENDTSVEEMKFAKSSKEMAVLIHNHITSLSILFFAVGGIFYFSSLVSEGTKRFLMIEPFIAIVTTFGGIALVRNVSPAFSWLVILSGTSLFVVYVVVVSLIMKEMWFTRN